MGSRNSSTTSCTPTRRGAVVDSVGGGECALLLEVVADLIGDAAGDVSQPLHQDVEHGPRALKSRFDVTDRARPYGDTCSMVDVFQTIAARILEGAALGRALIAVDGVDGSGKTTFTTELVKRLHTRPAIVLHADDFLNPSVVRHARGRRSPQGFWLDSYNYRALRCDALDPLRSGGDGWYRTASYDPGSDTIVRPAARLAPRRAVVVVEGLFLHRDELVDIWDMSVFLDVPFEVTA